MGLVCSCSPGSDNPDTLNDKENTRAQLGTEVEPLRPLHVFTHAAVAGKDCTVSKPSGSSPGSCAGTEEIRFYLEENGRDEGCRFPSHLLRCWEQLPIAGGVPRNSPWKVVPPLAKL